MENSLREQFLKVYANVPLNLRGNIILVLDDGRTITWDVAFFEIKEKTEFANQILKGLNDLCII